MKKIIALFILLFLSASVFAATSMIYQNPSQTIAVTRNTPNFTLKLKSNPTTGYSWSLLKYDNKVITPVTHSFQRPTQMMIGAGGYELWQFRVQDAAFANTQHTAIVMAYVRPWEKNVVPKKVIFNVKLSG